MANYLSGFSGLVSGLSGLVSGGIGGSGGNPLAPVVGAGGGGGSKPRALHTEYATGDANWQKPYGAGTDIVFYLMRADKSGNPTSPNANDSFGAFSFAEGIDVLGGESFTGEWSSEVFNGNLMSGEAAFGAASQLGPGFPVDLQSPLNQVGTWGKMSEFTSGALGEGGLAGPLTGLKPGLEAAVGATSQPAATFGKLGPNIRNALRAVGSLTSPRMSLTGSERFFDRVLTESFSPGLLVDGLRTTADIAKTFDRGEVNSLSVQLSRATDGVTTATQLIEMINKGIRSTSTPSSAAEAARIGPQGDSREKVFK